MTQICQKMKSHNDRRETFQIYIFIVQGDHERMFYIDNEEFELKTIKLKLMSDSIKMFCPAEYASK